MTNVMKQARKLKDFAYTLYPFYTFCLFQYFPFQLSSCKIPKIIDPHRMNKTIMYGRRIKRRITCLQYSPQSLK